MIYHNQTKHSFSVKLTLSTATGRYTQWVRLLEDLRQTPRATRRSPRRSSRRSPRRELRDYDEGDDDDDGDEKEDEEQIFDSELGYSIAWGFRMGVE